MYSSHWKSIKKYVSPLLTVPCIKNTTCTLISATLGNDLVSGGLPRTKKLY